MDTTCGAVRTGDPDIRIRWCQCPERLAEGNASGRYLGSHIHHGQHGKEMLGRSIRTICASHLSAVSTRCCIQLSRNWRPAGARRSGWQDIPRHSGAAAFRSPPVRRARNAGRVDRDSVDRVGRQRRGVFLPRALPGLTVDQLRHATRQIASGDLDVRVSPKLKGRHDELGLLASDLDTMSSAFAT